MVKIQIKSEKLSPFGGIFSIMEQFDSTLSSVIDSTLGMRCRLTVSLTCGKANTPAAASLQMTTSLPRKRLPNSITSVEGRNASSMK